MDCIKDIYSNKSIGKKMEDNEPSGVLVTSRKISRQKFLSRNEKLRTSWTTLKKLIWSSFRFLCFLMISKEFQLLGLRKPGETVTCYTYFTGESVVIKCKICHTWNVTINVSPFCCQKMYILLEEPSIFFLNEGNHVVTSNLDLLFMKSWIIFFRD